MVLTRSCSKIQMCCINASLRFLNPPFRRWITSNSPGTNLFVVGLSHNTNETILKDTFEAHGEVIEAKVICDHKSSDSKRYGFVRFTSETAASKALAELDGQLLDGRKIRVKYAHKQ